MIYSKQLRQNNNNNNKNYKTVKPRINRFKRTKHKYSLLPESIIAIKENDRPKWE